ncbi:Protein asteroid 1 [Linnemannia schmuckeri]|uniref:Protein asteroid 1 n=1 Tax=Linnemannia schmuckeri TaxID=64567 RepID=A0A9P5VDV8_9FUNG|nr:Protein asteroid 1 [Linnemannia schmuckeri]
MGVLGLYSYFESKSLGQRKSWSAALPSPSSPLSQPGHNTGDASGSLKRSYSLAPDSSSTDLLTKRRFFIFDGNAYIHHLYCGQFEWIWGGQYSSFVNLLTAHIRALENSGFRLQFLFDGPLPVQKRQTRLTRDTEKIRKMSRVVGDLEHYHVLGLGGGCNTLTSSEGLGVEALANQVGGAGGGSGSGSGGGGAGGAGGKGYSHFLIPPLVMEVTLQTLRALGVELLVCDGEADGLVAQLAMEKSMDANVDEAYAVSKDSDYFIYNTGSSTKGGYIPLDSLFVATDPSTGATTVAATVYSQSIIADHLGIRPHFLPLFASLTGNDYLRPELFEDQIARSLAAATGQKLSAANNTNHARIKATASFLKQYGAGAGTGTSNGGEEGQEEIGLLSSLSEYDQVNGIMDEILKDREQLYTSETEERRQELRSALIESMEQYSPSIPDDFSTEESISEESSLPSSEEPTPSTSIATSPNPSTPSAAVGLWAVPEKSSLSVVAALNKTKEAFRTGQFSFKLMDVVSNRMFWCTPFLEDTDRESAWLASRDLRRWIYGILARDLLLLEGGGLVGAQGEEEESGLREELEVVEYVRRGDHLSAEIVMGASAMELDEMVKVVKAKAYKKSARRISVMDVDPVTPSSTSAVEISSVDSESTNSAMEIEKQDVPQQQTQGQEAGETMDEAGRTSLFLGILGADTAQVRALPKPFMILAATLRYLINALAHSKTRSASISVANFEVIAFVASVLFLREMYYPETIGQQQSTPVAAGAVTEAGAVTGAGSETSSIPITPTLSSGTILSGPPSLVEAPPMTKRSLHLSTQYQHALATVSLLASALHLEDMIPPLAQLFDGLLFQQTLALARGGTLLEGRMQFPESVSMYHQILAAVEEDFVDTGEIDVVVVFRANRKGASGAASGAGAGTGSTSLGIFGPDMEPLNQLPSSSSTSISGGSGLKASKSAGIQKKSGSSKKRSGGAGGGSNGGNSNGRSGGSRGGGGGANMFNVLSLGCEF